MGTSEFCISRHSLDNSESFPLWKLGRFSGKYESLPDMVLSGILGMYREQDKGPLENVPLGQSPSLLRMFSEIQWDNVAQNP
jgi:hypothetical protein